MGGRRRRIDPSDGFADFDSKRNCGGNVTDGQIYFAALFSVWSKRRPGPVLADRRKRSSLVARTGPGLQIELHDLQSESVQRQVTLPLNPKPEAPAVSGRQSGAKTAVAGGSGLNTLASYGDEPPNNFSIFLVTLLRHSRLATQSGNTWERRDSADSRFLFLLSANPWRIV
jgi:hypothetical protein